MPRGERADRLDPRLRTIHFANVPDAREPPQRRLPLCDLIRQRSRIARFGRSPPRPQAVHQQSLSPRPGFAGRGAGGEGFFERRLRVARFDRKLPPQPTEILRIQPVLFRDGLNRLAPLRQCLALLQRGEQILLDRQPTALIGVKDDPLQVDLVATARVGELAIEVANVGERLVRPIARRLVLGKPKPIGQQDGMPGDLLRRIEILRDHRR